MKRRTVGIWSSLVLGVTAGACDVRPNGDAVDGHVQITASASVGGVPLPADGVTRSDRVVIDGSMLDRFGVASSSYSWGGGPFVELPLDEAGAFQLHLPMVEDANSLVLHATSLVGDDVAELALVYVRDVVPPVIEPPSVEFAASIIGEGEMELEKNSSSFTLSGGTPVPVRDGVSFSKYSSRYGVDQPNRPVWRFHLADNYGIEGARLEYRIWKKGADEGDLEEQMIDWTSAEPSEAADFELTVSSTLNERIGSESGVFVLEVRAFDGAQNVSDVTRLQWTQAILNPPIFIATGNETIMGSPGGPRDPRSYVIGENFSGLQLQDDLVVGSLILGNPNDVPVFVRLVSVLDARSSYGYRRSETAMVLNVSAPTPASCGVLNTHTEQDGGGCYASPVEWSAPRTRVLHQADLANPSLTFEVRTAGGNVIASDTTSFVMPANTELFVMATLPQKVTNLLRNTADVADLGPFRHDVTVESIDSFLRCDLPSADGAFCQNWSLARDFRELLQYYATWEFSARVESKPNIDISDATPFQPADPALVDGYSLVLATASASSLEVVPSSHNAITVGF